MKDKTYKILIIDDHPLISEAYKSAFNYISKNEEGMNFEINVAHDCDTAFDFIKQFSINEESLDIVFLDIKLPPSKDGKILSGEDLGLKINYYNPEARIIVSSTYNDAYTINSILKSVEPEGFLIKNDIKPNELVTAIKTVLANPPYYSKTVQKLLREDIDDTLELDDTDKKLLFELSLGTSINEMPNVLPLSVVEIEKRKNHLKQVFNIDKDTNDKELFKKAKEKGFI